MKMKKHLISVLALVIALGASAFTSGLFKSSAENVKAETIYAQRWWDFNGDETDQADPSWYSIDEDNFPDCTVSTGLVYCEIKAQPSFQNPEEPDLSTIVQ